MNGQLAIYVLNCITIDCPLCKKKKEKFRTKYLLRLHLKRNHTEVEAENFIEECKRTKSYEL